jgi:hypothetical protein
MRTDRQRYFVSAVFHAIRRNEIPTPRYIKRLMNTEDDILREKWYYEKRREMLLRAGYTKVNDRWQAPEFNQAQEDWLDEHIYATAE